ncbi:MAG: hypothetical protein C0511_19350 [Hyphomicrobium sp.]|nr:hypothetical protein [Hyphomicrobium sp.]
MDGLPGSASIAAISLLVISEWMSWRGARDGSDMFASFVSDDPRDCGLDAGQKRRRMSRRGTEPQARRPAEPKAEGDALAAFARHRKVGVMGARYVDRPEQKAD